MKAASRITLLFLLAGCGGSPPATGVFSGFADLRGREDQEVITLDGTWLFLDGAFATRPGVEGTQPLTVPGAAAFRGGTLGFGTYFLTILSEGAEQTRGLRLPWISAASRLYVNGQLWAETGRPGASPAEEEPAWRSLVIELPRAERLELALQVSNWHDRDGGLKYSPQFGPLDQLNRAWHHALSADLALAAALALMGLYQLGLFAFRPRNRGPLWFGLLCLSLAFRSLAYGEILLSHYAPGLPWDLVFRGGYLTLPLATWLLPQFIRVAFPGRWPWGLGPLNTVLSALYGLACLFLPTLWFSLALNWFHPWVLLMAFTCLAAGLRAVLARDEGAGLFLTGLSLFVLAVLTDMIISHNWLSLPQISPFGLLGLVICYGLIMALQTARLQDRSEELTQRLSETNQSLQRFVPREFLGFLQRPTVMDVRLGDWAQGDLTLMFADIRRFRDLRSTWSPSETFAFLNQVHGHLGPLIRQHGGFIDKYLGDGLLAVFAQGPESALEAALAIRRYLRVCNRDRQREGLEPFELSLGLHSGPTLLGAVGEQGRIDSAVLGETARLAARVQEAGAALGAGLTLSAETLARLADPGRYPARLLDALADEQAEPLRLFELFDPTEDQAHPSRSEGLALFQQAVLEALNGQKAAAAALFAQVRALEPSDEAALAWVRRLNLD